MQRWLSASCLALALVAAAPSFIDHPAAQAAAPAGATARCGDGTYSKAKTQRGACSSHGGVATWFGSGDKAAPKAAPETKGVERPAERSTAAKPSAAGKKAAPAARPPRDAADATAQCNDGTYSYAAQHRGACSNHGGVKTWFK